VACVSVEVKHCYVQADFVNCLKLTIALFFLFLSLDTLLLITYSFYGLPALISDCFLGSPLSMCSIA